VLYGALHVLGRYPSKPTNQPKQNQKILVYREKTKPRKDKNGREKADLGFRLIEISRIHIYGLFFGGSYIWTDK